MRKLRTIVNIQAEALARSGSNSGALRQTVSIASCTNSSARSVVAPRRTR